MVVGELPEPVDFLVVGAGAAGTLLGLELARHGIEARVVDRLPGPSPYSRAITSAIRVRKRASPQATSPAPSR